MSCAGNTCIKAYTTVLETSFSFKYIKKTLLLILVISKGIYGSRRSYKRILPSTSLVSRVCLSNSDLHETTRIGLAIGLHIFTTNTGFLLTIDCKTSHTMILPSAVPLANNPWLFQAKHVVSFLGKSSNNLGLFTFTFFRTFKYNNWIKREFV